MPIFVASDSADVWANPDLFHLDERRRPTVVAGVPPDYFYATGQLWGNPLYNWEASKKSGHRWWIARLRATLQQVDLVRIDHFRGFEAYWEIPAHSPTAQSGRWVKGPGAELFEIVEKALGSLPVVAEDLGLITQEVDELREQFNMPGMRVLQFGFTDRGSHVHLPQNFVPNTVVYTGTHDNNTTLGWWREDASGKFNLGWTRRGEWLVYTVEVKEKGVYTIEMMVACNKPGGTFHLEMNGVDVSGAITIPDTGAWQSWQSVTRSSSSSHLRRS